jgi:hypothetical protein
VVITVVLWLGLVGAVREWYYARKGGAPITRTEKWYLAEGLLLAVMLRLVCESIGLAPRTTTVVYQWSFTLVIVAWAARQMVRRTSARACERPTYDEEWRKHA